MKKQRTSHTLSLECKLLLKVLSKELGISQASVLEMLVREKARALSIKLENADE